MAHTLKLNNGKDFPVVGLGTFKSPPGKVQQAVKDAIDAGYRHFDCAWFYGNEAEIGEAIRAKIADGTVTRDDLFITTKLWNNFHAKESVLPKLRESIKSFGLDYVDLYLIHWPIGFKENASSWPANEGKSAYSDADYLETWQAMEEGVKLGLTKSIGISNFNSQQIDRLLGNCQIKPVVNQVEMNPNINQRKLVEFCKERNIVITAYCPLGKPDPGRQSPLEDAKLVEIANRHQKTPAQIVLKYLVDFGVSVIPKSVTKSRIIENINIFDIVLDADDKAYLDSLNKNERICHYPYFADHTYYPFNIEY